MEENLGPLFYKSLLENLHGDVAIIDADFKYIYINPYAMKSAEMRQWIVGKTDLEYCEYRGIDVSVGLSRQAKLKEALESKRVVSWEESLTDDKGNIRYFLRKISPVFDVGTKELLYFIGHGIEITEMQKIRHELEENKRITDAILGESPNSIFIKDEEGKFVLVNNAVATLFDTTPDKLISKHNAEVHSNQEEAKRYIIVDEEVIRTRKMKRVEETFTKKDGTVFWFDTVKVPLVEADGSVNVLGISTDITERKSNENLLRESERQLIEAQALSKSGSFEFNTETNEIFWSQGMYLIYELDNNVKPSWDLFFKHLHPDDKAKIEELSSSLVPDSPPWYYTFRLISASGKLKHIEVFNKYSKSNETGAKTIVGSFIDITERIEIEEKLRLNDAQLNEVQEIAKLGTFELDLLTSKVKYSRSAYHIYEWDENEPVPDAKQYIEMVHPDDREYFNGLWELLPSRKGTFETNFRVITKSGKLKYIYTINKLELSSSGAIVGIIGIIADITERKQVEEKIRFSENSLLQAQRIAKLGSFYYDIQSNTFDWTEGVNYIWEIHARAKDLNFEEILDTIHPEDKSVFIDSISRVVKYGDKQLIEFRIIVGENKVKNIEARLRVYDYDNGRAIKLFGTVIDITERKFVEQELVKAKKMAEESSKAKELFLANISHELRTPLNGILGMSRLLKKSSLSSVQRNYTEVLHQTAENLLVIISEILDFTRIEEGKLTLEEVSFDPKRVADTAVNLQMFKAEEKDILLRHKHIGNTPLPKVIGDPYRLSQILLNLLNNAIKFTNYGEVLLSHKVVAENNEDVEIEFSVMDTGIGIPKGLQDKIFESFTQLEIDGGKNAGVGLGLTISKNLIEKQGGRIWVESEENVGSTFYFSIKYKKSKGTQEKSGTEKMELRDLGTLNILLAEDNKVNLFITESMLNDWGFNVDIAGDGEEVLRLMELKDYDMVLMDIQMPIMDGLEATKRIREMRDPNKSRVPVIALTANTGRQAHKQFMTLGMNDWVVKPFKEETLYRKMAMHLRGKDLLSESMKKRKFPIRKKPVVHPNDSLYDLSALKNDQPSNRAFLIKMLSIFVETIPISVETMFHYFERDEFDQVSKIAHKIKPSIDGAGIVLLRDCIRNLEDYKEKERNVIQIKSDLILLRKVIAEVVEAFKQEIEKLKVEQN